MTLRSTLKLGLALTISLLAQGVCAAESESDVTEDSTARYQVTYNAQTHAPFRSLMPAGANSLPATREYMYTFSATAHWGRRLAPDTELYFNPELVQGVPFSNNLVGLGGFTNGEITRAAGRNPGMYRQRLFLRQTWGQGGEREKIESDFNQMAGWADRNRWVLTVGNFSLLDVFDDNAYAKDPRTQFMNWGNWTYAAYDYAADARGFGWGAALEWYQGDWVLRAARMNTPLTPNSLAMDFAMAHHFGDQIEIDHAHRWGNQPGRIRLLAYNNRAVMANFDDATAYLARNGFPAQSGPDALIAVRGSVRSKQGVGLNLEQALNDQVGVFVRTMKSDGKTETLAFTEVDQSLSMGALIQGTLWGRGQDTVGLSQMINRISAARRRYLQAGGVSFFIGDGYPNARMADEKIIESFYSLGLAKGHWLTLDWQRIVNPAYNADRGPARVLALRWHAEF
jgi:high affinity Mn2+ porin